MPLVLRIERYCVFFWANEGEPLEPVHVHVSEGHPVPLMLQQDQNSLSRNAPMLLASRTPFSYIAFSFF